MGSTSFSKMVSVNPPERLDKSEEVPFVGMEDLSVRTMFFIPKEVRKGGQGSKFEIAMFCFPVLRLPLRMVSADS